MLFYTRFSKVDIVIKKSYGKKFLRALPKNVTIKSRKEILEMEDAE